MDKVNTNDFTSYIDYFNKLPKKELYFLLSLAFYMKYLGCKLSSTDGYVDFNKKETVNAYKEDLIKKYLYEEHNKIFDIKYTVVDGIGNLNETLDNNEHIMGVAADLMLDEFMKKEKK